MISKQKVKRDLLSRYSYCIEDWYEPSGEEFKYDIFLRLGYAFAFWYHGYECQRTEHFETLAQVRSALSRVVKVDPITNCSKCPHWNGSSCCA